MNDGRSDSRSRCAAVVPLPLSTVVCCSILILLVGYDVHPHLLAETGENDERQYFQKELSIIKSLLLAYKRNEMQNFGKLAGIFYFK